MHEPDCLTVRLDLYIVSTDQKVRDGRTTQKRTS